ncbi:exported hypothetical protein [Vibrio nigripulchritudo SFn118]|nr:exported hypothetical protein [Vibrio nigripulchritudo SFn118]
MTYKNRKSILIILVSTLIFTLKIFTAIVEFKDDPYTLFVFKHSPSFESNLVLSERLDLTKYTVITSDENGIIGQDFYEMIMNYYQNYFVVISRVASFEFNNKALKLERFVITTDTRTGLGRCIVLQSRVWR